jgi:hypothetical protein
MSDAMNKPPISAENLSFFCSQLLDDELPAGDIERLLQQTASTPAAAELTQQLHRYALIRQHLQARQHSNICSHVDLSARVQAALANSEHPVANDDEATPETTLKPKAKIHALRLPSRAGRTTWALSGLAAGIALAITLPWLNQFPASSSTSAALAVVNGDSMTRPVTVQELNQDALMQQAQMRAYAQLADAQRARFNEYYLMHAGYGGGQNASLTLARVGDLSPNDNGAFIVQPVGYQQQ